MEKEVIFKEDLERIFGKRTFKRDLEREKEYEEEKKRMRDKLRKVKKEIEQKEKERQEQQEQTGINKQTDDESGAIAIVDKK